jgi:hypothetical protein
MKSEIHSQVINHQASYFESPEFDFNIWLFHSTFPKFRSSFVLTLYLLKFAGMIAMFKIWNK